MAPAATPFASGYNNGVSSGSDGTPKPSLEYPSNVRRLFHLAALGPLLERHRPQSVEAHRRWADSR